MAKMYSDANEIPVDKMPCDSSLSVEWVCEQGHTWNRTVINQMRIRTCPICAKRVPSADYSLFAIHPELANEWDEELNAGIEKNNVMPNANKKLWWKCNAGHTYQCTAADRHRGKGCPFCAGKKVIESESIAVTDKEVVEKYWNYERNVHKPTELSRTSKRKVWVNVDGHDILIAVDDFIKTYS
jgi:hypothetical protein